MRSRGTTTTTRGLGAGVGGRGSRGRVGADGAVGGLASRHDASGRLTAAGLAAVTVAVVGVLAGCTAGEPGPTPTWTHTPVYESPQPTPTPTPTPTDPAAIPPERPAAMDTVDTAGAEAVATYYTELFPYVFATGDLEAYQALSHPECIFCADVIRGAEEQHAAGGHSVGGLMEIVGVTALEVDPGKWWAVSMDVVQAPSVDLDDTGSVVTEVPEKTFHLDMAVVIEGGHWLVRAVEYQRTDQ